jgi:uncharacterized protein (TIGR02246 family)
MAPDSDEAQIHALVERWLQATRDGDADAVLDLMTDDALFLVPGRPPMHKAEFAAAARAQAAGRAPRFDGRSEVQEVQVAGNWAFLRTQLEVTATPPDGSPPSTRRGQTLGVLRRDGGRWRLARDANLLTPVPPPSSEVREAAVARTGMLIRRPPAEVFEAFVDPAITRCFWFSDGSARLDAARTVTWTWRWFGVSAEVQVIAVEPPSRLVIEWPNPVEWSFEPRDGGTTTFVRIVSSGFAGDDAQVVRDAIDQMGGFAQVLAAAKAWLEHGVALNLVADHNPDAHVTAAEPPP